jgi:hypothetical protein
VGDVEVEEGGWDMLGRRVERGEERICEEDGMKWKEKRGQLSPSRNGDLGEGGATRTRPRTSERREGQKPDARRDCRECELKSWMEERGDKREGSTEEGRKPAEQGKRGGKVSVCAPGGGYPWRRHSELSDRATRRGMEGRTGY